MIVVDSSVWIDFINGGNAPHVRRLRTILGVDEIIVGDLMLCEVLQGLDSERAAREVEALLRRFEIVPMAGDAIATAAARNFPIGLATWFEKTEFIFTSALTGHQFGRSP